MTVATYDDVARWAISVSGESAPAPFDSRCASEHRRCSRSGFGSSVQGGRVQYAVCFLFDDRIALA